MSGLPKEIYIVVAESDFPIKENRGKPIAFESEHLDYDSAKAFQDRIKSIYGKTAIYKAERIK